jgi:hypothetical protein
MQAVKKKSISNPSTEGTNYPCIILFFIVTCRSCRLVFFLLMEVITDAPFSSMCVFLCVCRGRKESQDSEEEEEVVSAKWTLRKQAALVLDNLAVTFSAALVLPHALAAIQLKLQAGAGGSGSAEVWVRESGMLALGALSTGCLVEMGQYLPQLFPFLIQVKLQITLLDK